MNEPEFKKNYRQAAKLLQERFGYENVHQVPQIKKVVISCGTCEQFVADKQNIEQVKKNLSQITGQQPVITKAKKAISNFKTRELQPLGAMITLRGNRMYSFLERAFNYAFPRIPDFNGFKRKSNGTGTYSCGIRDVGIFVEIHPDAYKCAHGMNITITTTAKNDEECLLLLEHMGFPFRRRSS